MSRVTVTHGTGDTGEAASVSDATSHAGTEWTHPKKGAQGGQSSDMMAGS
jgi:hypothetical protein